MTFENYVEGQGGVESTPPPHYNFKCTIYRLIREKINIQIYNFSPWSIYNLHLSNDKFWSTNPQLFNKNKCRFYSPKWSKSTIYIWCRPPLLALNLQCSSFSINQLVRMGCVLFVSCSALDLFYQETKRKYCGEGSRWTYNTKLKHCYYQMWFDFF